DKTASIKEAEIESWMKAFGKFRSELRNILGRHGIFSNLGWGDDEVLRAISNLLESKDAECAKEKADFGLSVHEAAVALMEAECQKRIEGIFREIEPQVEGFIQSPKMPNEMSLCIKVWWQALKKGAK
ncbi:unnamed protein product, partial [marine sediment metagenome]